MLSQRIKAKQHTRWNSAFLAMFIILRKPRAPWSLLRAMLSKRQYFKRDAETATYPVEKPEQCYNSPAKTNPLSLNPLKASDTQITHKPRKDTMYSCDTDAIVDQLAVLAATVSQSSHSATSQSTKPSLSSTPRTSTSQSDSLHAKEEEDESFDYLSSLISISSLPQHSPHNSTTSADATESRETGHKRTSSRLSLRLGGLSFPSKVPRKPCPRYSPLPPVWTPKTVTMRPEVRF